MPESIVTIVAACAEEVAEQEGVDLTVRPDADTALFGPDGLFDSMGLVSLVVAVEQAIEDAYACSVSLADERAMAQRSSPFRTVGSLAAYAQRLVDEQA